MRSAARSSGAAKLRLSHVRDIAASILVLGHLVAIFLVFVHLHAYFETAAEKLEIVLILSPLTGLFALAGLKSILSQPERRHSSSDASRTTAVFAIAAISIPAALIGFVIYAILAYPFGAASDPTSLRMTLASVEVALSALVGAVAETLFGVDLKKLKKDLPQVDK